MRCRKRGQRGYGRNAVRKLQFELQPSSVPMTNFQALAQPPNGTTSAFKPPAMENQRRIQIRLRARTHHVSNNWTPRHLSNRVTSLTRRRTDARSSAKFATSFDFLKTGTVRGTRGSGTRPRPIDRPLPVGMCATRASASPNYCEANEGVSGKDFRNIIGRLVRKRRRKLEILSPDDCRLRTWVGLTKHAQDQITAGFEWQRNSICHFRGNFIRKSMPPLTIGPAFQQLFRRGKLSEGRTNDA